MATKIRNQKAIDWNSIKLQAFAAGFQELYNFITTAKLDRNNALVGKLTFPQFYNTKKVSKIIREQANTFGLKCGIATYEFGNTTDGNDRIDRKIELGAYW